MPENNIYHITESVSDAERDAVIRTIMMMAPPFAIGNCKVCNVDVRMLSMDMSYQRNPHQKSKRLRTEFNMNKVKLIELSYRDGLLFVIDGGHRIDAAMYNGIQTLPALIHEGLTDNEEAQLFAEQNDNVVTLRPFDTFRANVKCGKPVDSAIYRICTNYGVVINENPYSVERNMTAITACRTIMNDKRIDGEECLDWILTILQSTNWLDARFTTTNKVVTAFHKTYKEAVRENSVDAYKNRLIETLSHINVEHVTKFAAAKYPQFEHRAAMNIALLAIGRGDVAFSDIRDIVLN